MVDLKTTTITVRLTEQQRKDIKELAESKYMTMSNYIAMLIDKNLKENEING